MKVLYFGYSWWEGFRLDPYQQSIVDALVKGGHEVHICHGNRFTESGGTIGFTGNPKAFARYIKQQGIQLVLCKNNAGNYSRIRDLVDCPFVIWVSDEVSHIFKPDGEERADLQKLLDSRVHLFVTTSKCERFYSDLFPNRTGQIHFVPHCTSPDAFRASPGKKSIDISFVGSSLDLGPIYRMFRRYARPGVEAQSVYLSILDAIDRLKNANDHDFDRTVLELGLRAVLAKEGMSPEQFRMFCANLISNNERFQIFAALREFDTAIFGNLAWLDSISFTTDLIKMFRPWHPVRTFEHLVEIYQNSKISISIPQHQVGGGVQYRVLDIMASDALLITKYSTDSDLIRIFGPDCPVPTYHSPSALRDLCEFYIQNEDARLAKVEQCKKLIDEKFTFEYRLREMFDAVGLDYGKAGIGRVIQPNPSSFLLYKARLSRVKRMAQKILGR